MQCQLMHCCSRTARFNGGTGTRLEVLGHGKLYVYLIINSPELRYSYRMRVDPEDPEDPEEEPDGFWI